MSKPSIWFNGCLGCWPTDHVVQHTWSNCEIWVPCPVAAQSGQNHPMACPEAAASAQCPTSLRKASLNIIDQLVSSSSSLSRVKSVRKSTADKMVLPNGYDCWFLWTDTNLHAFVPVFVSHDKYQKQQLWTVFHSWKKYISLKLVSSRECVWLGWFLFRWISEFSILHVSKLFSLLPWI